MIDSEIARPTITGADMYQDGMQSWGYGRIDAQHYILTPRRSKLNPVGLQRVGIRREAIDFDAWPSPPHSACLTG